MARHMLGIPLVVAGFFWLTLTLGVLPGFGLADCTPLQGDSIDEVVRWGEKGVLPTGSLRLRFVLEQASIYSFKLEPS
jgi:hypothetical protein